MHVHLKIMQNTVNEKWWMFVFEKTLKKQHKTQNVGSRWASLLAGQRAASAELLRLRGDDSAHIANFGASRVCWGKRIADP